jgi:murein L,D-transpeptidase YcbB/YkuD
MATVATVAVKGLAADWKKCYTSAKLSGIVPDRTHLSKGGYHCSRQDQPRASNYSVVRPDDKGGRSDAASAIDMTMNPADMRKCTARLVAAYSNLKDPRRKYINAFNGTTNNRTATRWDVYARKQKSATKDHLWHVHLSIRRKYTSSPTAMKAILSLLKGESLDSYLKANGGVSVSSPEYKRNDKQKTPSSQVKKIQEKLGVKADGFFGADTEKAVKAFQKKKGLKPDGIVGPKTLAMLFK